MQYCQILVNTSGLSATDVNKFLLENPVWHLWQVVPLSVSNVLYVLEGPLPKKPGDSTPAGGLKEGATLSERMDASKMRLVA